MLMSRQGVSDGRSRGRDLSGECRTTHRISFVERRNRGVLSFPGAEFKTAFCDLAAYADNSGEVAI